MSGFRAYTYWELDLLENFLPFFSEYLVILFYCCCVHDKLFNQSYDNANKMHFVLET